MKRAASKTAKPRAPAKKRAAPAGVKIGASLMDQMQEQQNLLELQNEQLCEARAELEQSQHRFADLYDQAPVGYLTLDGGGCIREINQTASQMLGWSTAHMLGRPLLPHLAAPDRRAWLKHLWESRRSTGQVITTLRLLPRDGVMRRVQFATSRQDVAGPQAAWCRTAMLDITEKSDAQSALSASEAKFRLLADNMGEVFWFMKLDPPRVTYVSPAFERIWGVPVGELYADRERWEKAIHPDDRQAVHAAFDDWISGATGAFRMEYRVLHPDGQIRWIADRGIVIGRKDGKPHEISGIARDITERKHAEQKVKGVLEAAPDAMIIVNQNGRIEYINAQAVKLFGYTPAELLGQCMEMLVPERFRGHHAGHRAVYGASPKARPMGQGMELFALRKNRSEFPVEISLSPLETAEGMLVISTVRDITEQVRIKGEIQQARRLAESTLEAVPASLAVLDAYGRILSTNQAWTHFAAANRGTFNACGVGANYLEVCDAAAGDGVEEAARFVAGIREVISGESPRFSMEYACHSPTQMRCFVGYVTPFLGNSPHSVVIAHVDISERKRAEQVIRRLNGELEKRVEERTQALQQANAKLRQEAAMRRKLEEEILHISEHEKQRIGQDLHDDLGQQLAGIWLLSDLLKANLIKQRSPEAESAEKITSLLKDALGLTRSLARGLHPVAVQAGGLIAALDELTTRTSDMFRINCRCKCPPSIDVDNTTATHLYRIAQEAVTNAVKHGLAKEIDIELSTNPHHTVLSVKDQGKGKGKGKHVTESDSGHRGMGLRIMRYRADIIGGILDIQRNQSGIGTTVVCTIPTPPPPPSTDPTHG